MLILLFSREGLLQRRCCSARIMCHPVLRPSVCTTHREITSFIHLSSSTAGSKWRGRAGRRRKRDTATAARHKCLNPRTNRQRWWRRPPATTSGSRSTCMIARWTNINIYVFYKLFLALLFFRYLCVGWRRAAVIINVS
jgi:hypothetical protein